MFYLIIISIILKIIHRNKKFSSLDLWDLKAKKKLKCNLEDMLVLKNDLLITIIVGHHQDMILHILENTHIGIEIIEEGGEE